MTTVAIVAALDRADSVAATVAALLSTPGVDEVVVVDDGSTDRTSEMAAAAGAAVLRLPANLGKGAAVSAGVAERPAADVYLLVDADVADTAAVSEALLAPLLTGQADMTIGVLPSAGRRGGFGAVKGLARAGIRRAVGTTVRAPLSGQRAVRGELLRSLALADRFGLETALTIDAVRAGARVREVDVAMEHRHTGRRIAGFRHRAGQGVDIVRALWPRLTSRQVRLSVIVASFVTVTVFAMWSAPRAEPSSVAASAKAAKVVLFGVPHLGWTDIGTGRMPNLDAMVRDGAVAAMSVRTASGTPTSTEGYASLGAGVRVEAQRPSAAAALPASTGVGATTAAGAVASLTGVAPSGQIVVMGGPATISDNADQHLTSAPGALGDALRAAGKRAAVVDNADGARGPSGVRAQFRPAAIALMASDSSVDAGQVSADLLLADPTAPGGVRADPARYATAVRAAMATADVVLVDPGDVERAAPAPAGSPAAGPWNEEARARALADTDRMLGDLRASLGPDTLLLVVSVAPRDDSEWHTTPMVATGAGVRHGYLHSPSTRRLGVVTLTDVAPTVLDALGVPTPDGMIGHPLRYHPAEPDLAALHRLDRDATYRERIYLPLTLGYIVVQAIVYLLAMALLRGAPADRSLSRRTRGILATVVLGVSAYPLSTFLLRAVPSVAALGGWGVAVLLAIDAAVVAIALRFRRHPLSPLSWILGATVALFVLDVATGARLQSSSLLGYSVHTAARFTGLGNAAFAILAATTLLLGCIHVQYAPRRTEAVVAVGCLFALVVLVDGAPMLGSDVGGILTLVPVFGLTLYVLAGGRFTARAVLAAVAVTLVVLVVATGVDLLRPPEARTHLGRLVTDIGHDGIGVLGTTVSRKIATNFRTYRSPWTWAVVVLILYMLYVFGWTRAWRELLPPQSALRVGALGTLGAGLLGYAVNDSGVVVAALVFVYIGPFLTLLALHRAEGSPTRIPPVPVSGVVSARAAAAPPTDAVVER